MKNFSSDSDLRCDRDSEKVLSFIMELRPKSNLVLHTSNSNEAHPNSVFPINRDVRQSTSPGRGCQSFDLS